MRRHIVRAAVFLTVLVVWTDTPTTQDKARMVDALLTSYHDAGIFNGTALVSNGGHVVFKKGYGFADFEWKIPNTPDTKFRIGSITKQFTSTVIVQLVDEGKLSLDATLSSVLPYYRTDTGSKITVHHLLTHTSGIPSYTGLPNFMRDVSRNPYGVREFVEKYCSGDLEFEPGSRFLYNNSGYFLLGAMIEAVTNKPYAQVLRERVFEPLGMAASGYDLSGPILEKRARGYENGPAGVRNADYLDMGLPYAAGFTVLDRRGPLHLGPGPLRRESSAVQGERTDVHTGSRKLRLRLGCSEAVHRCGQGGAPHDWSWWWHQRFQHADHTRARGSSPRGVVQ